VIPTPTLFEVSIVIAGAADPYPKCNFPARDFSIDSPAVVPVKN
jgi:hypothetical protein